jgi:hypothetical protein
MRLLCVWALIGYILLGCEGAFILPPVNLFNEAGFAVSINANNHVISSRSSKPSNIFLVSPCLASFARACVSISPSNDRDSFVRHFGFKLFVEPKANPRNPHIFALDASFMLCKNCFLDGYDAFESVNFPGYYIVSGQNNEQMSVVKVVHTVDYYVSASFITKRVP